MTKSNNKRKKTIFTIEEIRNLAKRHHRIAVRLERYADELESRNQKAVEVSSSSTMNDNSQKVLSALENFERAIF